MQEMLKVDDFTRFKETIFCKYIRQIDIENTKKKCINENCNCNNEKIFNTLIDLYSHFYYLIDGINVKYVSTIQNFEEELYTSNKQMIDGLWEEHIKKVPYMYSSIFALEIHKDTYQLIKNSITEANYPDHLMILLICWLEVLDNYIGELALRGDFKENIFPYATDVGEVILKRIPVISTYIEEKTHSALTDVNYNTLRNRQKNLILVENNEHCSYLINYKTPRKSDLLSFLSLIKNVGEVKFGLVANKLDLDKDYEIENEVSQDESSNYFYFKGINKTNYTDDVLSAISNMIREYPDFVMLAELNSPKKLQDAIQLLLRKHTDLVKIFLTGSFHIKSEDIEELSGNDNYIYNYGKILDGQGNKISGLYKTEKFKSSYLTEKIAYNQRKITLIETPLGRIAVFICVDFLTEEVERIIIERQIDIVFVLAMTPNPAGGNFEAKMRRLGSSNNAMVIVCNNSLDNKAKYTDRHVVYLPTRGKASLFRSDKESWLYKLDDFIQKVDE